MAASLWMTACGGYRRDTEAATIESGNLATGGVQRAEANTNGDLRQDFSGANRSQRRQSQSFQSACSTTGPE